jgi:Asp-tRNA(Asn)/Glu-tRNA(Gln) amidotransferase A subunit family amidase
VILGKTVTTEFANNNPSHTHNPRNLKHTPGGSSSGSAAAVGDEMVPLALGTQTGGSTIRPASYCGAVGYKPSFNTIARAGLKFVSESLDTIGIIARSAEDAALCVHVLSARALPDFNVKGAPRVGVYRSSHWQEADQATRAGIEAATAALAKAGARVSDAQLPASVERLYDLHNDVMGYESARTFAWEYTNHLDKLSANLRKRLDAGWALPRARYDAAREGARAARRELAERMKDYDFLLTPGAPGEAPARLDTTGDALFNRIWTLLGVPCVTLPNGKGPQGLPLGVQLIGRMDDDSALLAWAHWAARQLAA